MCIQLTLNGDPVDLLIASHERDGGLFVLEHEASEVECLDRLPTAGLAVDGERGCLYRLLTTPVTPPLGGELLTYDPCGLSHYARLDFLRDPHDLICWRGELWGTCTEENRIYRISRTGYVRGYLSFPEFPHIHHLNNLTVRDGELYATAFAALHPPVPGQERRPGVIFDVARRQVIRDDLASPHHPAWVDGSWIVCDSRRNALLRFGPDQEDQRVELGAWTRGLAVADQHIICGLSARRSGPPEGRGAISILDRTSLRELARVSLPAPEVYALALVPRQITEGIRRAGKPEDPIGTILACSGCFPQTPAAERWLVSEPISGGSSYPVRLEAEFPAQGTLGGFAQVRVRVHNLGEDVLHSGPPVPFHIALATRDPDSRKELENRRVPLPHPLLAGESVVVEAWVPLPDDRDRIVLEVAPVQELVCWIGKPESAILPLIQDHVPSI